MIQKKVCMLGGFAVGKTSMVSRFVSSIFSDKYLSTVGTKIDKKVMTIGDHELTIMLWDIFGQDTFQTVHQSYLRGASGYILVIDGTRAETLAVAQDLHRMALQAIGDVPFVVALNKADLESEWQINEPSLWSVAEHGGWDIVKTSAKTGAGVEKTFDRLARAMLKIDAIGDK